MGRRSAAQHDVDGGKDVGDPLEGHRLPVVLPGKVYGAVVRPVGNGDALDPFPG